MSAGATASLERWYALGRRLGLRWPSRVATAVHAELVAAYRESWRSYHNLAHLEACLTWLDRARGVAARRDEIEWALWFHDAVYETSRSDNEERSADWAARALAEAGADASVGARVHGLILATGHGLGAGTPAAGPTPSISI